MKAFKNILCAYDFSEHAEKASDYAIKLTKCSGEKLIVAHVLVNPFLFEGGSPLLSNNVLAVDLLGKLREEEEEKLNALKARVQSENEGLDCEIVIEEDNDIVEAIQAVHEKYNTDLVVIGSHGRKGLKRVFLGSVAEGVLRNVSCPVLIIK